MTRLIPNFFLLAAMFLYACSVDEKKPILLIPVSTVNLAEIKFDSSYQVVYNLYNRGEGILVVDTVTASCGCTTPSVSKKIVEPGDSSVLVVGYKPVDTGWFDKKIVIKSNTNDSFSIVSFQGRAIR